MTTLLPIVIFAAIALFVATVIMIVRDLVVGDRGEIEERLNPQFNDGSIERLPTARDGPSLSHGRLSRWFHTLLIQSGMPFSPETGFLLAVFIGLVLGGALFVWFESMILLGVGIAVGIAGVTGFFYFRRHQRIIAVQHQLPEVMEMLARAVRAGESLEQAVLLTGDTVADPLGTEFRRCARHLEMGLSMEAAMRALTRRAPISETRILATTLVVQRQTGGSLPVTLERLANVIRDRISYKRQFRAVTASGRLSAVLITMAAPLVLAYFFIFQRNYIADFIESTQGQSLLGVSAGLMVIGLMWVYGILRIDY